MKQRASTTAALTAVQRQSDDSRVWATCGSLMLSLPVPQVREMLMTDKTSLEDDLRRTEDLVTEGRKRLGKLPPDLVAAGGMRHLLSVAIPPQRDGRPPSERKLVR